LGDEGSDGSERRKPGSGIDQIYGNVTRSLIGHVQVRPAGSKISDTGEMLGVVAIGLPKGVKLPGGVPVELISKIAMEFDPVFAT